MNRFALWAALAFLGGCGYSRLVAVWFDQSLDPIQVATRLTMVLFIGLMAIAIAIAGAINEK